MQQLLLAQMEIITSLLHWKRVKSCIDYLIKVQRIHINRFCFQSATCILGVDFLFSEKDDAISYGMYPPKPLKKNYDSKSNYKRCTTITSNRC
jgi:hypothetical protein